MTRVALASLALSTAIGCAGPACPEPQMPPRPARVAHAQDPAPRPARAWPSWLQDSPTHICDEAGVPVRILFGCRDASLEFETERFSTEELLDAAKRAIFAIEGVERVRVRGYQSRSGPEADMPLTLSQRRADAVARALIRRGVDPARIETITAGAHYSSYPEGGDPCPPMEEDRYGFRERVVEFDVLYCAELDEVERFFGRPALWRRSRRRTRREIFRDHSEPERTEHEPEE